MPNFDGKGPQRQGAMTGRRRGRCCDEQKTQVEKPENQSAESKDVFYGLGRGGIPHGGGGFRNHFGRGNGKGPGRGCGRGLGNG